MIWLGGRSRNDGKDKVKNFIGIFVEKVRQDMVKSLRMDSLNNVSGFWIIQLFGIQVWVDLGQEKYWFGE